jgi:hypothetical protein
VGAEGADRELGLGAVGLVDHDQPAARAMAGLADAIGMLCALGEPRDQTLRDAAGLVFGDVAGDGHDDIGGHVTVAMKGDHLLALDRPDTGSGTSHAEAVRMAGEEAAAKRAAHEAAVVVAIADDLRDRLALETTELVLGEAWLGEEIGHERHGLVERPGERLAADGARADPHAGRELGAQPVEGIFHRFRVVRSGAAPQHSAGESGQAVATGRFVGATDAEGQAEAHERKLGARLVEELQASSSSSSSPSSGTTSITVRRSGAR